MAVSDSRTTWSGRFLSSVEQVRSQCVAAASAIFTVVRPTEHDLPRQLLPTGLCNFVIRLRFITDWLAEPSDGWRRTSVRCCHCRCCTLVGSSRSWVGCWGWPQVEQPCTAVSAYTTHGRCGRLAHGKYIIRVRYALTDIQRRRRVLLEQRTNLFTVKKTTKFSKKTQIEYRNRTIAYITMIQYHAAAIK